MEMSGERCGIVGRFLLFIQALYNGTSCRVKVGNSTCSAEFPVNAGLRQGCVLSPLLFSLYINNVVETLKRNECGLQCGSDIIPAYIYICILYMCVCVYVFVCVCVCVYSYIYIHILYIHIYTHTYI